MVFLERFPVFGEKCHDDQRDNLKKKRSATSLYVTYIYYIHCTFVGRLIQALYTIYISGKMKSGLTNL